MTPEQIYADPKLQHLTVAEINSYGFDVKESKSTYFGEIKDLAIIRLYKITKNGNVKEIFDYTEDEDSLTKEIYMKHVDEILENIREAAELSFQSAKSSAPSEFKQESSCHLARAVILSHAKTKLQHSRFEKDYENIHICCV